MTDTDFDFDFDVNREGSRSPSRSRDLDDDAPAANGSNGSADGEQGNGSRERERDPFDALTDRGRFERDEGGEPEPQQGNGEDEGSAGSQPGLRRFRPRRYSVGDEEDGGGGGASFDPTRDYGNGSSTDSNGGPGAGPPGGSGRQSPPDPGADEADADDWLSLTDDAPADRGLNSIAEPDDGPAGPRTVGEGRSLAREARRRASGKSTSFDAVTPPRRERRLRPDLVPVRESSREHELEPGPGGRPHGGGIAGRGAAVLYGLRGLLDHGRQRLRGAGGRLGELRERVPDRIPRPGSRGARGGGNGSGNGNGGVSHLPKRIGSRRPRRAKPGQIKKLRIAIIFVGLAILAMVSTVFGMMVSVAGDVPQLENKEQYARAKNSEVFDAQGRKIGTLLSNSQRILVESEDISPYIKQAVVAIEDQRFYEHRGVDYQGIGRAVVADLIPGGSTQGASTITQQFVKNALEAQSSRTYFQKLREAAFAYHLERQWDKDKILTQYLNTIYFGEGAYGIEAAARTYFGSRYPGCGLSGADPCSAELAPEEAAMLAGIISSPSAYSPRANPNDAGARRNLVLQKMNEQDVISDEEYELAARQALPAPSDIEKPEVDSLAPYYTEWLRQQLVDKYGPGRAFGGGLDVVTTLDLDIQEAAESAAYNTLAGIQPTASVVVIDNETGGVKAMVGGNDFQKEPFNLATNGLRQPGSAFKPFTLITAFQNGFSTGSTFASMPLEGDAAPIVPNSGGKERFTVNNYDDVYYGTSDLVSATLHSDNSIFAQLGVGASGMGRGGPEKIAQTAHDMGIATDFSTNPAMILGGLDPGVSPLEMAYAFSTIARDGIRVGGELDSVPGPNNKLNDLGPTGISEVKLPDGEVLDGGKDYNEKQMRAIPESVAETTRGILRQNVLGGTGENAQTGSDDAWGKTGTTENNGDAWFCGGTENFTACVWVGHSETNTPMETEFSGAPVDGGTFPALIWSQVMQAAESILEQQQADEEDSDSDSDSDSSSSSSGYVPETSGGSGSSGSSGGGSTGGGGGGAPQPAPAPAPAPSGGGGSTGGTGGTGL